MVEKMIKVQLPDSYRDDPAWWQALAIEATGHYRYSGNGSTKKINNLLKKYGGEYKVSKEDTNFDSYVVFDSEECLTMCILAYSK